MHPWLTFCATLLLLKAFVLTIVGVATEGWVQISGRSIGISLAMGASNEFSDSFRSKGQAAYALCIIATLGAGLALTIFASMTWLQYMCMGKCGEKLSKLFPLVTLLIALIGGLCGLTGCIIQIVWAKTVFTSDNYSDNYDYMPGYSWGLTFAGSLGMFMGGVCAFRAGRHTPENFQRF